MNIDLDALHKVLVDVWYRELSADEGLDELHSLIEPQRQWVGLTDEEVKKITDGLPYEVGQEEIRSIEAKLKEKNT